MTRTRSLLPAVALIGVLLFSAAPALSGKTVEEVYRGKLSKLKPDSAAGQYRLAKWCKGKGLDDEARGHFEKVISLDPDHRGARRELGYVSYQGRWLLPDQKARVQYEEKRAEVPKGDAEARYDLGVWCRKQGLFEEATREFAKALELDPAHSAAKRQLESSAHSALERKVAAFLDSGDAAERRRLLAEIRRKDRVKEEDIQDWIYFVTGRLKRRPKHEGREVTKLTHPRFPVRYRLLGKTRGENLSLLVLLHSGGPTTPSNPVNDRTWEGLSRYRGAPFDLLAMPRVWNDTTGAGWVRESGPVAVAAMIDEIRRAYPVDPNRIYLWGYSMGGYGTCWIGSLEPDRFAAVGILAAGHSSGGARPVNLLHVPVTVHIGERDQASDHVGSARRLRDALGAFREAFPKGYACRYREYPGVGHQLPMSARTESFAWMKKFRRDPLPRTVVWEPFSPKRYPTHKPYYYWLHIEDPRDGMRIEAKLPGENRVTVTTRRVSRFTVFLNDRLVDPKKAVVVSVDGRIAHRGVLEPSLTAIVESMDAKEDPEQVFTMRVDVGR